MRPNDWKMKKLLQRDFFIAVMEVIADGKGCHKYYKKDVL